MRAKISFIENSFGCQNNNGEIIDWQAGGVEKPITIDFDPLEKLSNKVSALKSFNDNYPVYQFGNSFTYRTAFKVEILED